MKKLTLFTLATLATIAVKASPLVQETPVKSVGTPTTVAISTSAWTKVPASSTLSGRSGVIVDAPATLNANLVGILDSCTSTAVAITVRPIEVIKGNSYLDIPIGDSVCLYLLSLHTGAESIHIQEYKK